MNVGEVAGPLEGGTGVYIFELAELEKADENKLKNDPEEMQKIRSQILSQKQRAVYDSWYQTARKNMKIKSFVPELYQET